MTTNPRVMQCINMLMIQGIKNLKIFGYDKVNFKNLCSDDLYRSMFNKMLIEIRSKMPITPVSSENEQSIQNYKTAILVLQLKIKNNGGDVLPIAS